MGDCPRCYDHVNGKNRLCNSCQSKEDQKYEERGEVPPRYHKAAKGFHGYVDHPTHFLVGEAGPERVNITPIKKKKTHHHVDKDYYDINLTSFLKGYDF